MKTESNCTVSAVELTVTVKVQLAVWPLPSVAVYDTVVMPALYVPLAGPVPEPAVAPLSMYASAGVPQSSLNCSGTKPVTWAVEPPLGASTVVLAGQTSVGGSVSLPP